MAETLDFSRSLYLPEAVQAAVDAYAELASLSVAPHDGGTLVTIRNPDPELADVLVDELANHALHETIVRTRGGD